MSTGPTATAATFGVRDLRLGAAGMVGAAAVWPVLPVHPPLTCPLRATTGLPCPLCGLTRAVTAAVHGDLVASLRYNPGGIVLVVLAVALLVTWRPGADPNRAVRVPTWLVLAVAGALWAWNLTFNPTFDRFF